MRKSFRGRAARIREIGGAAGSQMPAEKGQDAGLILPGIQHFASKHQTEFSLAGKGFEVGAKDPTLRRNLLAPVDVESRQAAGVRVEIATERDDAEALIKEGREKSGAATEIENGTGP